MQNMPDANAPGGQTLEELLRKFFRPHEYACFKALQFYSLEENGAFSSQAIRREMPKFARAIGEAFSEAKLDAWSHYTLYGTGEGINPSNNFNTLAYLKAKANALNRAGKTDHGGPWTIAGVAAALSKAHMSALEHFLRYAGKGAGEVPYALTAKGEIPSQFIVPDADKVDVTGLDSKSFGATITLTNKNDVVYSAEGGREKHGPQVPVRNNRKIHPGEFFSASEYLQFKALQFFQQEDHGGLSVEQIRRNLPMYAGEVLRAIRSAGLDPWTHYKEFGSYEGVNPCNAFDTISYLQAKARALNAAGELCNGEPWTAESVSEAFRHSQISALEHFVYYAGTGVGEVEAGLTDEGSIPEEFSVSDVLHVPPLDLPELRVPAKKPKEVPATKSVAHPPVPLKKSPPAQFPGKRAVSLGGGNELLLDERLPEYSVAVPEKKTWNGFVVGVRNELWRKSLARRLILLTVILPGIFIFFYLLFWASNAYISETKFAVRGQNNSQGLEGFSAFFNLPTSTQNDSYIVQNYIQSYDMFSRLDRDLGLKEHYSDRKYDFWYRLAQKPTQEDIQDFWEWACEVAFDPDTGILSVAVKAFTPEMALAICQAILNRSEELVNAMNDRARRDAIAQSEREVARAEERIRRVREQLHSYREQTVILDPEAVAMGLYGLVNKLENEVAQTQAELSEAQTFMKQGSPRVRQLETRLQALRKQLASEKKRLAGKLKGDSSLNDLLSRFQALTLEEEFAQKQLTSAMASLEAARVRADAQSQYVEAFQRPVLADQSLYPRPVLFSCIYMITALLLLGLISLIIAAVREHAGF